MEKNPKSTGTITVLAGAGTMLAMNDLKTIFEKENPGTTVNIQYGNSGELFAKLNTDKNVDAVVPGDINFMDNAKEKGFIDNKTVHSIVYHIPIIAVAKGNPENITSVKDLAKPGMKVGLADKNSTAVGKLSMKILNKTGQIEGVNANVIVYTATVNQLLPYLTSNKVDAVIITEDLAYNNSKIDVVEIPASENEIATIGAGLTSFTNNKELAKKFENFIISNEEMNIWQNHGFKPVNN